MRELELVGRCRSLPPIWQWLEAKKAMSVTHRDNFSTPTPTPTSLCNKVAGGLSAVSLGHRHARAKPIRQNAPFRLLTSSMLDDVDLLLCLACVCVSNS